MDSAELHSETYSGLPLDYRCWAPLGTNWIPLGSIGLWQSMGDSCSPWRGTAAHGWPFQSMAVYYGQLQSVAVHVSPWHSLSSRQLLRLLIDGSVVTRIALHGGPVNTSEDLGVRMHCVAVHGSP